MNILVTFNSDYLMPARVLIRSILENNSGEITIFILHHSLSDEEQSILRRDVETGGCTKVVFLFAEKLIHCDNPNGSWISDDTYLRLMAQELLPQDVKRYLYLDADTVVRSSLEEFYQQDMEGNLIAALGFDSSEGVKHGPKYRDPILFSTESFYFYANVMLVDLEAVRKEVDSSVYFRIIERMGERLRGKDQDVLNIVFNGRVKVLDMKYDTSTACRDAADNVTFLHYGGSRKPWKYCYDLPGAEIFWEYAGKFPEYRILRDGILAAQEQFKADRKRETAAEINQE